MVKQITERIAMKKLLLLLFTIYISLVTLANANGVEATVSSTQVVAGNMAQLKIKATGNRVAFPNITDINGVPVLGRHESQNNSYSYMNGTMSNEHSSTLVLTFAPQKEMTIPSFTVNIDGKEHTTKPIALKVVKATVPQAGGQDKFSLQLRTNTSSVIVGEPVLATVYFSLQNGVRLSDNPQYNKPEFKGFFTKEVGEEKSYNQGNRRVTELRYLLIPKAEGNYTVGPATAKIGVADRNRRDMFGRFFGTTWIPIASNSVAIEVKPKPAESDLVGHFTIENSIDAQSVKVNKPVNLTVKISGEGSLEDFEFPSYEIDGVTVYSDEAKVTSNLESSHIESTYVKSFAFISDHDFSIPARSISVYDTKAKHLKQLEIPAFEIKVQGTQSAVSGKPVTPASTDVGVVQTNLKIPERSMLDSGEAKTEAVDHKREWWLIALAFMSGFIVMFLLRYFPSIQWKKSTGRVNESEALRILYPHINASKEIEAMVRKLYAKKGGDQSVIIDKKVLKEMIAKVSR